MMRRVLRFLLILVGIGVVSFVGGLIAIDWIMGMVVGKGEVAEVPEVVGMPAEEAARLLDHRGLTLLVDHEEFDAVADSGVVIGQRPGAGDRVKLGRRIAVVLSRGPEGSTVPELVGERVRQARIELAEVGLDVGGVLRVHHDQVGRDLVISTFPVAGTSLVAGENVDLLVSLGPEPARYLMPSLQGKRLSEVRRHLGLFDLSLARVTYQPAPDQPQGLILDQVPPAGARVDRETSIEVVVASP